MSDPEQQKEPTNFIEFAQSGIARIRKMMAKKREEATQLRGSRINDLKDASAIGVRARGFMQSSFWNEELLPWLQEQAGGPRPWRPGQPFDPYEVRANHFYASGRASILEDLARQLVKWDKDGQQADIDLAAEKKKHEAMNKEAEARQAFMRR